MSNTLQIYMKWTKKAEHTRKGINNCAWMEKEKKVSFGLKKTIYDS